MHDTTCPRCGRPIRSGEVWKALVLHHRVDDVIRPPLVDVYVCEPCATEVAAFARSRPASTGRA